MWANFTHFSPLPFLFFLPLLSVIHPSLQSHGATVARPGRNALSGLIKTSRHFLATVNKSSGQRSLYSATRVHLLCSLVLCFRSLRKNREGHNKESTAVAYFWGVCGASFDSPAICWIPLKAPRLLEEVACWSNWWQDRERERGGGNKVSSVLDVGTMLAEKLNS